MRSDRGPIDEEALYIVERIFTRRLDTLIDGVEYVPSPINPVELRIGLRTGFASDTCRFNVQWWMNHGYKYHCTEDSVEFRFGWEVRPNYPDKHFHPPEDLSEHRQSCIHHEEPDLVTLAVLKCWWDALSASDLSLLNEQRNPP